jgi:hypothetical protein
MSMPVKAPLALFAAIAVVALLGGCRKKQPKSQFDANGFGGPMGGMPAGGGGGGSDAVQRSAIPPGISWMCFRDLALSDCDNMRNTLIAQDQQAGKTSNLTNCGSQTASYCHTYKRYKDGSWGFSCSMDGKDCEGSRAYYKKKAGDFGEVSVCASVSE